MTRLALFVAVLLIPAALFAAEIEPVRLRCEYRDNPLGIDSKKPRLSWIVVATNSSSRALRQTAYQVRVATTPEKLVSGESDLWDSGRVESDETIQIEYGGKAVGAGEACYWSVRVWDGLGQVSPWGETSTWTVGLFGPWPEQAKWIALDNFGADGKDNTEQLPLLRREFSMAKPFRRAIVSVCGLGFYELFLNGAKIGDHIYDPGWTDYRTTCLYATYDVTAQVRDGKNCLGAMLGNGMYRESGNRYSKFTGSFGEPKLVLRLRIDYTDGTRADIVSDDGWRASLGPITFSSIFGGEDYDARLEQPGWDRPGFDDSGWQRVAMVGGPGGRLTAQSTPPIKVMKTFEASGVTAPKPGVYIYDLGQNFSGRPLVSLRGPAGGKVVITPAEALDENGLASQEGSGGPCYYAYTLKGEGVETWRPQFSYYGFRYLQVEGALPEDQATAGAVAVVKMAGEFTRNSAARVGDFACSNDLMNRIYSLIDWSIGSNLQSVLTDCPHREKLGWLEIAHLMGPSIMDNYDVASTYAKIARDTMESQHPDGMVPTIAPEYDSFPDAFGDSPEWGSAAVLIPWQLYRRYGDRRVLTDSYPTMQRYVDYLASRSRDHIVSYGLGDWGDFPSVKAHMGWAQLTPVSLTDTAIYYQDATIMARVAALLGRGDVAGRYSALADEIRESFNRVFLNTKTNQYVAGMPIVPHEVRNEFNRDLCDENTGRYAFGSQASQAIPLALGLVEPDRVEAVFAHLVADVGKQEYVTAGDVGHRFLLLALEQGGRNDLVYKLHNRTTVPGYGWQIQQGLTSQAEAWDGRAVASLNHCQMGHIQEWFHTQVLGIENGDAVAFKEILIRPQIVGDLRWARGSYDSIRGPIKVDWRRENGELTVRVFIPANTSAMVQVPTTDGDKVRESGRPAAKSAGVTPVGVGAGAVNYKIESGAYVFTSPLD